MITMTDQVLAMLQIGQSKPEITAHLRRLKPDISPTYLTGFVGRTAARARREDLIPPHPEPATTG